MPNPLSWFFHHLPKPLHRVEVLGNFFAQLVVPLLLFAPQPVASLAGAIIVLTQAWLVLSGNFSWLNFLTMTLAFSAFDDRTLSLFLSVHAADLAALPLWWQWLVLAVTVLVIVLSYRPVLNLISPHQLMNFSFDRFHPFRGHRPVAVRANLYRYRFSTWDELRRQGVWWVRTPAGEYLPTLVLDPAGAPAQLHRE